MATSEKTATVAFLATIGIVYSLERPRLAVEPRNSIISPCRVLCTP